MPICTSIFGASPGRPQWPPNGTKGARRANEPVYGLTPSTRQRWVGFLQTHLLREIARFLAERIFHGPVAGPTGAFASSTAAGIGFKQVWSVTDLQVNPLRQRQRRHAILAYAGSLAIRLKCLGNTVHQAESVSRSRPNVGNRARPQTALGRLSDHRLVNPNRGESRIERIALAGGNGQLLVQIALDRTQARLDNLLDFAGFELLGLFELAFLIPSLRTSSGSMPSKRCFSSSRSFISATLVARNSSSFALSTVPSTSNSQAPSRSR